MTNRPSVMAMVDAYRPDRSAQASSRRAQVNRSWVRQQYATDWNSDMNRSSRDHSALECPGATNATTYTRKSIKSRHLFSHTMTSAAWSLFGLRSVYDKCLYHKILLLLKTGRLHRANIHSLVTNELALMNTFNSKNADGQIFTLKHTLIVL